MAWVLVKPGQRLFTDLNSTFPLRDRRTDGSIGNRAHELEVSGHNPDDTPGVRAEYSDADTKQEVRADDVDVDLHDPRGVTLWQVMNRMISRKSNGAFVYPNDVRRLKYMIHRGQIASRNTNWEWRNRTPADHYDHGHFSFDPDYDEDGSEWTSVTSFKIIPQKEDTFMALSEFQQDDMYRRITNIDKILWYGLKGGENTVPENLMSGTGVGTPVAAGAELVGIRKLNEIHTEVGGSIDPSTVEVPAPTQAQVNAAVKAALLDPEVLTALKQVVTIEVTKE